jgi:hypothetical protein
MRCCQALLSKSITFTRPSHSPRHQRRSMSVLPASGETAKEGRATASPLSTEAGAIFEQYFGTGSPGHKTTNKSQPRLPFILGRLANDRWLRGSEHDQEGTGKMGRQGSSRAATPPHRGRVRPHQMTDEKWVSILLALLFKDAPLPFKLPLRIYKRQIGIRITRLLNSGCGQNF